MKSAFKDFYRYNLKCQDSLEKLRQIISSSFGIDDFWHVTLYENGHLANVSTYYEQWGVFYENEGYKWSNFFIAPSRLKSGIFLLEHDPNFMEFTNKLSFPQHHSFMIVRKEGKEKADIFGFAAREHRPHLPSFYVNNLSLLNSFIDYYLTSSQKFMKQHDENMLDIASLLGKSLFYNRSYGDNCLVEPMQHSQFFSQIGIDPMLLGGAKKLSNREKAVLSACYEGKTAMQHAKELGLSPRTIQFYLGNAKNKLGVDSREELVQNLGILKMAGYFS